jgi:hypothetical protein
MTDSLARLDIPDDAKATLVLAGVETMFHAKLRWNAEDIAVMREHYPKGGLVAVRPLLSHKTDGAIYQQARAMGVKAPGYKRKTERYFTTPHIDEAIRRYYHGTPRKGGLSKLAHQMQRPAAWVSLRARQIGCAPPRFRDAPWSEPEIALLRENAAKLPHTISRIMARYGFRRTSGAVSNKLMKLRCDRSSDDTYTGTALAELFNVSVQTVSGWIRKGWLKAQTRGTAREHDVYVIHHKAVRRFVIENAAAVDIRRVDKHWFIDLLAGSAL